MGLASWDPSQTENVITTIRYFDWTGTLVEPQYAVRKVTSYNKENQSTLLHIEFSKKGFSD